MSEQKNGAPDMDRVMDTHCRSELAWGRYVGCRYSDAETRRETWERANREFHQSVVDLCRDYERQIRALRRMVEKQRA